MKFLCLLPPPIVVLLSRIEEMVSPRASPRESPRERCDSDMSKLTLEEEGLTLDDPEKPG